MCRDYLADNLRRLCEIERLIEEGQHNKALEQIRLSIVVLRLLLEAENEDESPATTTS